MTGMPLRVKLVCVVLLASWFGASIQATDCQAAGVISTTAVGVPSGELIGDAGDGSFFVTLDRAGPLINAGAAQIKYPTITGAGYTVAVLDTGVDYTHPALTDRYVGGYDFVNGDGNPDDDHGHGTHVCGIVASDDATYQGIAPEAGYAAVKVLNSAGSGTLAKLESGLQWVIDNCQAYNITAVNMSLGDSEAYNSPKTSRISDELATLRNAGVFIVAASGNDWYSHSPDQGVAYPAADPSVVSVGDVWTADIGGIIAWDSGAKDYTTGADRIVSHCDRSTTMLDLLAPGAPITSAAYNWEGNNADFVIKGGTSMAAPVVAGLSLLIRQAIEEYWSPALQPTGADWQDVILGIMQSTGVAVYDGDDEDDNVANLGHYFTRIDALASLDYVMSVPEPGVWAMLLGLLVTGLTSWIWHRRR